VSTPQHAILTSYHHTDDFMLFFGMGLFVETNGLVLSTLTFGAICVAFAVFLMLELGLPYTGLFRVSPAALQEAIANIDK
jgi:hypothetical protein